MPEQAELPVIDARVDSRHLLSSKLCVLVFASFLPLSVIAALFNVDDSFPRPTEFAIGFGLFWGAWLLVGCWFYAHCKRFRAVATAQTLAITGTLQHQAFKTSEITSVRWRCFPRWGSVKIRSQTTRCKIDFGMLAVQDRTELFEWLKDTIPDEVQLGRKEFEEAIVAREWPQGLTIEDLI